VFRWSVVHQDPRKYDRRIIKSGMAWMSDGEPVYTHPVCVHRNREGEIIESETNVFVGVLAS
jgi:hypothetical protein